MEQSTSWPHKVKESFSYMGKKVKILLNKAGDMATITIEKKKFKVMLHTIGKPEDNYIKLWMCEEAYVMLESPEAMAKHIIEYWYQYK